MEDQVFNEYAHFYSYFYNDKNYAKECRNLIKIAKSLTSKVERCLEVGAGTGSFTQELAKDLLYIYAFELSPSMANICSKNVRNLKNIVVHQGDLHQILTSGIEILSIDLVCANFHVFTYFDDKEIDTFLKVCETFLRIGGLVAFDFWDLDAVCNFPPGSVTKFAQIEGKKITRHATPAQSEDNRQIEIKFEFYDSDSFLFEEKHKMYPRSLHEVIGAFEKNFEFCGSYDVDSGKNYSLKSYGNLVFFKKRS